MFQLVSFPSKQWLKSEKFAQIILVGDSSLHFVQIKRQWTVNKILMKISGPTWVRNECRILHNRGVIYC
jgi:ribonuclease HI